MFGLRVFAITEEELLKIVFTKGSRSHKIREELWETIRSRDVLKKFVALITEEMVYDDGDMYYKVNPDKYINLLVEIESAGKP